MKKKNVFLALLLPIFLFSCRSEHEEISCDTTIIWKNNCTFESKDGAVKLIIEDNEETGELVIKILAPGKWDVGGFFSGDTDFSFGTRVFKSQNGWLVSKDDMPGHWSFSCQQGKLLIGDFAYSEGRKREIDTIWLVNDSYPRRHEMFLCLDPGEPLRP